MLGWLRFPTKALHALGVLVEIQREALDRITSHKALEARLDALERSRALWEADMVGALAKLESQFKATRAAEERIRHAQRREDDDDEFVETDQGAAIAATAAVANGAYAFPSETAGLPPVQSRLGDSSSARARKWGRG